MARPINQNDTYRERLLKHLPTETLGTFMAANGVIMSMDSPPGWMLWVVFIICLGLTPLWLIYGQGVKSVAQNVLAAVAFVLWVMTLSGGPFGVIPGYPPLLGSVLLIIFSGIVAPLVAKSIK